MVNRQVAGSNPALGSIKHQLVDLLVLCGRRDLVIICEQNPGNFVDCTPLRFRNSVRVDVERRLKIRMA